MRNKSKPEKRIVDIRGLDVACEFLYGIQHGFAVIYSSPYQLGIWHYVTRLQAENDLRKLVLINGVWKTE